MILNDYTIKIFIRNELLDMTSSLFAFNLHDSIHEFYSLSELKFKDIQGMIKETANFTEGDEIDLSYTVGQESLKNKFVVINKSSFGELSVRGQLSDPLKVQLRNIFYDNQTLKSKAYNNSIGRIITLIAQDYGDFKSYNIETTDPKDIWYQPYISDADFINKILMPNVYSKRNDKSPIFCWINNDNELNLQSYKAMENTNSVDTLFYKSEHQLDDPKLQNNFIQVFRYFTTGSDCTKNLRHRKIFQYNNTSGALETTQDYIDSYPTPIVQVPIIGDSNQITSYKKLISKEDNTARISLYEGQKIQGMKDSLFLERAYVKLGLNLKLNASKKITLDMPNFKLESSESSSYFSGDWIIEQSDHYWTGINGYTELIISRKKVNLTSEFKIRNLLFRS